MTPHTLRVYNISCSTLYLSWEQPDDRGSLITSYFIRYKYLASNSWSEITVSSSSANPKIEAKLNSLLPTTLYEIQVGAGNEVGNGSFSETVYAWTTAPS